MTTDIEDKLQALYIAYADKLPGKIEAIVAGWAALNTNFNAQAFQDFHRQVHTLCGSAGTYGYMSVSASARKLEIYLKQLLGKPRLNENEIGEINLLVDQLKKSALKQEVVNVPSSTPKPTAPKDEKLIYIFDNDDEFLLDISQSIYDAGFYLQKISHLYMLEQAVKSRFPAALIVDVQNTGVDDIKYLQTLKQGESSTIPIICVAMNGDILTRLQAIRAGCSAFFQKPVDSFYITKTITQLCGNGSTQSYRILIVDDSSSLGEYYSVLLHSAGMTTRAITNPLRLIETVEDFQPDLILMDLYMPNCNGLELAAMLRQQPQHMRLPIIFLSTEADRYKQLSALSLGGDDFLTKPVLPDHLIQAVKLRAKRAGVLNTYMTHDSLTGLLNHTNILESLEVELVRASRNRKPLAFAMIDIDHFKSVNDNYGHQMGDKVIRKLSTLLATHLRKTDRVGRYGGEEFAIVMPDTDLETALTLCDQLRVKFSQYNFDAEGAEFKVTFSAGVAYFPALNETLKMVEIADQGLYKAKKSGRNQVVSLLEYAEAPGDR